MRLSTVGSFFISDALIFSNSFWLMLVLIEAYFFQTKRREQNSSLNLTKFTAKCIYGVLLGHFKVFGCHFQ